MAWITPVTDHTPNEFFTHTDMNRIYGNLAYLYDELSPYFYISPHVDISTGIVTSGGDEIITDGGDPLGASAAELWTQNDIYTLEDFIDLLACLKAIADAIGFVFETEPNLEATADNFNVIESLTYQLYRRAELVLQQANGNHYVGDPFYVGAEIYLGGLYGNP